MRIAIIHHQFKLKGGMETYLFNLINGFNQQQDHVSVYVYKRNRFSDESICEVKHKNLFWLPRVYRKYWFASRLHKEKDLKNVDLKISLMRSFYQDIVICGGTHCGFLRHAKKRKTCLDRLEIACEQKSYDSSALIIAHSNLLKQELMEMYHVPEKKIVQLFPPIDTKKFNQHLRSERKQLRKRFNFSADKKYILFPSTGHKRKGLSLIVEAFNRLPANQFELIVAGNPPKENFNNSITYVGFIEEMAELYTACDVTLLPSLYEPFGLVVVESLQCGTPVIISKHVGAREIVTKNEGIVLEDLSPASIAEAIMAATSIQFKIPDNFAEKNQLTINAHIEKLKSISPLSMKELR